jgi:hypothetical protein
MGVLLGFSSIITVLRPVVQVDTKGNQGDVDQG